MEIKTPKELLEKELPTRFKPEKAKGIDTVVQVEIKGQHGGSWTVTIKDQKMNVKIGIHQAPNLLIEIAEKDFIDLTNGKLKGTVAFFSGKLKLRGDMALALKLKDAGFL